MNDFTKEELEEILVALDYVRDGIDEFLPANPLMAKLQSMIDNYCEHEKNVWPLYTSKGDLPSAGLCFECNKSVNKEFINE